MPEPSREFDDFKVDQDIIENLKKCGYKEPTPIQKQAVPLMLEVSMFRLKFVIDNVHTSYYH